MCEDSIVSGNSIIAHYMGYDFHKGWYIHQDSETPIGNMLRPEDLKYHNNWDWIMSVVDKISRELNNDKPDLLFTLLYLLEDCGDNGQPIPMTLENVWRTAVDFISRPTKA